ncbi:MAG: class II aldolase/adducin family protein [Methanosphaera sp.]|uniref:class II aldolase/adducin family protein n=1 Tax=Methanosphaera sp. TaxID=2666342 RepID=UPI0025F8CC88|nr:class II aldolase/adducin family protein [Methanosphaera sp.]MCI5866708.1 class II aldolase/adducin family protein [Methanosphaera sp.]MDD6534223.1 class II aldolase/adducin family protein [Methanosphaera sp.]MDY3956393.1 class II aldolase/adducin family protein [Methanosphaera sp.]
MNNDIIDKIVKTAHYMYSKDLTIGKSGNISVIDDSGEYVYITASGTNFKELVYEDVLKVKIDDLSYESTAGRIPSMETDLHIGVYKNRSDVGSVVHVHSPYATGFAFSKKRLYQQEGFGEITGEYVAEVNYYPPGSKKLAQNTAEVLKNEDAALLKNHGIIGVGKDIEEATLLCEYIEAIAKTQYITSTLNL